MNQSKLTPHTAGISHLSYYLPSERVDIDEAATRLNLTEEQLRLYKTIRRLKYVRLSTESAEEMAITVGRKALADSGLEPTQIDAVVFFHSVYNIGLAPRGFVGRLQHELGLNRALGLSVTGQGCATVNSAIRVSRNMILAGSAETVLILGADGLQDSQQRVLDGITLVGDGASAIIMRKDCATNRLVEISSFDEGYFHCVEDWTKEDRDNFDLVYVIATVRLVHRTLRRANLSLSEIALLVPHNVNYSSWDRILALLDFNTERFFGENIALNGHAYGTDIIVNLADAIEAKRIQPGEYAMLMSAGIGTLGCTIIQH